MVPWGLKTVFYFLYAILHLLIILDTILQLEMMAVRSPWLLAKEGSSRAGPKQKIFNIKFSHQKMWFCWNFRWSMLTDFFPIFCWELTFWIDILKNSKKQNKTKLSFHLMFHFSFWKMEFLVFHFQFLDLRFYFPPSLFSPLPL